LLYPPEIEADALPGNFRDPAVGSNKAGLPEEAIFEEAIRSDRVELDVRGIKIAIT
jgi:hypothetical protein